MTTISTSLTRGLFRLAFTGWILLSVWHIHVALASPLPQDSGGKDLTSYPANGTSLVDPFSTPDYLGVEVMFGYKFIRFTMLVVGFLIWASVAVMFMLIADVNSGTYQASNVYFAVWFVVGLVGAVFTFYFWHAGIILTGAYGMFVVMAIIFTAANLQNFILRYTILAVCLVVGGYLTKRHERISVILSTSVGGAYSMMFGLDMFIQTEFRATLHVILSQSTARFHPVVGTWVLIGMVPVIALFGVLWELKRHDEPMAGWWFGGDARPLPPLPGEEKKRRCFGLTLSSPRPKKISDDEPTVIIKPSKKDKRRCCGGGGGGGGGGESSTTKSRGCCIFFCCGKRQGKIPEPALPTPPTSRTPPTPPTAHLPVEKVNFGPGHETIGYTPHHKVVIQKQIREFSMEVDERW
ncbi:hypothetical protein BG011_004119 [Mortierella polycephala]|uniref:Transmembrane protein 198 n=1 Tax=Mortierella polycephala TaxID=41804 RepID=A0A9P6QCR8_9FUNG|nr:hypothetical protein BG011_004119 [Mortierella polycephala]